MPETVSKEDLQDSLFLLDGSALAYRSHFAMARSNLSSGDGLPTGATFGFTMELKRILDRVKPRWIALVMDTAAPTFRHRQFPDYKATREKMPDDLVEQLPWIKDATRALGVPLLELDGYEADDIMGTLARRAESDGKRVFLVSGDKDFMQLVSDKVLIYNIMKRNVDLEIQGATEVQEKFGVTPDRVIDVLGLMGDSSDNVPGIPGIGEKTAKKLIVKYGSMDALLENPGEDISPKIRDALRENREIGLLSKQLVTIDVEVPIDTTLDDLEYAGPDRKFGQELFAKLGFRPLVEEMKERTEIADVSSDYHIVRTIGELDALIERMSAAPLYAVDTETTSLKWREARVVGVSFADAPGQAWYVPMNLDPPIIEDTFGAWRGEAVLEHLRPLLEDPRPAKCGQNVKYDMMVLRGAGIRMAGIRTDSMIAAYLLEPQLRERNLDALSLRHFDHLKIKTEELIGKGKNQLTMDLLPVDDVGIYACEDADFTWRLADSFLGRMEAEGLLPLHDEIEMPLVGVLCDMEEAGVRVDRDLLKQMAKGLQKQADGLEKRIREIAEDDNLNVNSPRQLGELLFERLKVHQDIGYKPKKTKTGWATGQEVLEALSEHPLPKLILEYRSFTKLLSTYINALPLLVDEEDGRIHTSFNQAIAATGRLSSSDPNLQNIPIRTETGRKIREAFLPSRDGCILLAADYSQVELRIMAHLSGDENLIQAFRGGADIHADTASRIFGVDPAEVDVTMRSRSKAINFGILYGMGPQRLARETGLTLEEAKTFITRYFDAFPAIKGFIDGLKDFTRSEGYAQTIMKRKRPLPDINSSNGMLRSQAENMAVNTPIQGSAADILKIAMVRVARRLKDGGFEARMILTVHDELVLDLPDAELEPVQALVVEEMEGAADLSVPLKVHVGVGANWLEAH
ncbi:MAG: DNA polymerase I [Planctomycetes bacterium]|nr:DNA polymerase I [Planctomycetota bacterium]